MNESDKFNLIIESAVPISGTTVENINESTGKKEKNYYVEGIFTSPGKKNRNGRIYPKEIWDKELERYQEVIQNVKKESLAEWQHPPRTDVDPMEAVARIVELKYMPDGQIYGKAKILNDGTAKTNKLKGLIDEGYKIGVSSRGVGKLNGKIVEKYRLITFDLLDSPSNYGSELNGVVEGVEFNNGVSKQEFIFEGEKIVCTDGVCTRCNEKSKINKSLNNNVNENKENKSYKDIKSVLDTFFKKI